MRKYIKKFYQQTVNPMILLTVKIIDKDAYNPFHRKIDATNFLTRS